MPCFFCNSVEHLTIYCNIHASDESRKKVAELKKCCQNCLFETEKGKFELSHTPKGRICYYQKCYICFTKEHSTVFCPNRFNTEKTQFLLSKIDDNLLLRFLKMFDLIEQFYLVIYLTPKIKRLLNLKPIKVFEEVKMETLKKFAKSNIAVNKELWLICYENSTFYKSELLPLKNIIFYTKENYS